MTRERGRKGARNGTEIPHHPRWRPGKSLLLFLAKKDIGGIRGVVVFRKVKNGPR